MALRPIFFGFIYLFADYQKYNLLNFVMYNDTKLKIQFNDNFVDYSDVNIFMIIRRQMKKIIVSYMDINSFINVPINLPLFSIVDIDKHTLKDEDDDNSGWKTDESSELS